MFMGSSSGLFGGMGVPGMGMGIIGFFYLLIGALYFFPIYYLHQFSDKIKNGLSSQDLEDITAGFQNLKSLFKFMGICTIIVMSIYALIFVGAIIAGAMR
jgi:hypothetical protein